MRPGDVVKHLPSGETWTVAAVSCDGKHLSPAGWPESIAPVTDCYSTRELAESAALAALAKAPPPPGVTP